MDQRNILYSNNPLIEFEAGPQPQSHYPPEPCILLGSMPNYPQPNMPNILPPPGNIHGFDFPHHDAAAAFYGNSQYAHQFHPNTNLELGVPAPAAFYNPYFNPGSGMFSAAPINHGSRDSSGSYQGGAVFPNGFGRHNGFRGSCKRNNAEGSPTNAHYGFNPSSAPGSSMPPANTFQFDDGVLVMDAGFPIPDYRGSFTSPSFVPQTPAWCDHPSNGLAGDPGALPFNQPPMLPYFEASNVGRGSSEVANVGGQRFHEGASTSRGGSNFLNSAPMIHQQHEAHPSQMIQGASRYNVNYHPHIATTSTRVPMYNGSQHGHSSMAPPPPTGVRIYRSHRRGLLPDGPQRHRDLPHFRIIPGEGTAVLEFPGYYEISNMIDHHRDMRLDIDYMSYEELLALGERIGNVNTGLSEETIESNLKTRIYRSSTASINLEELPSTDERSDSCVICQDEYMEGDKLGILDCGHEYHVSCVLKWLPVKNACPVCKSIALDIERKDG